MFDGASKSGFVPAFVREVGPLTPVLKALFVLLITYVLIFCVAFTLDFKIPIESVRFLTVCRGLLLLLCCIYLFRARSELLECIDPFVACVVAILAFGLVSGLFHEKTWFGYFRHGFQYACLLAFYLVGRSLGARTIPEVALKILSIAILFGYAVATALYAATPGLHSGSYSIQPNLALLPVAQGLTGAHWTITTIGSILVIIGNKRAVYVGLAILFAVALALWVNRTWKQSIFVRFATVAAGTPVIGMVLGVLVLQTSSLVGAPAVGQVVFRFTNEPTFNAGQFATPLQETKVDPVVRFTGGRNVEVTAVWDTIGKSLADTLFGHGFGSEFMMRYISPNDYQIVQFDRQQADVAPVHIALTSGVPLAVAFTVLLAILLIIIFIRVDGVTGTERALALFSIAICLDTMLGFNPTNPVCWMALGAVSRRLLPEFSFAQMRRWRGLRNA